MTLTIDIAKAKLARAAEKQGMHRSEIGPFTDAVAVSFDMNAEGKLRNASGLSPKKLVKKARTDRPDIFDAAKIAADAAPFNPATANPAKKNRNPYSWPDSPRREAAIIALVGRTPSSMLHTLSRAANCSISGKALSK